VTNIENCFMKSNLIIAAASGWLERLVRLSWAFILAMISRYGVMGEIGERERE